jgi:hypothetical protein
MYASPNQKKMKQPTLPGVSQPKAAARPQAKKASTTSGALRKERHQVLDLRSRNIPRDAAKLEEKLTAAIKDRQTLKGGDYNSRRLLSNMVEILDVIDDGAAHDKPRRSHSGRLRWPCCIRVCEQTISILSQHAHDLWRLLLQHVSLTQCCAGAQLGMESGKNKKAFQKELACLQSEVKKWEGEVSDSGAFVMLEKSNRMGRIQYIINRVEGTALASPTSAEAATGVGKPVKTGGMINILQEHMCTMKSWVEEEMQEASAADMIDGKIQFAIRRCVCLCLICTVP